VFDRGGRGSVVGVGESGIEFVEVSGAVAVEGRGRKNKV